MKSHALSPQAWPDRVLLPAIAGGLLSSLAGFLLLVVGMIVNLGPPPAKPIKADRLRLTPESPRPGDTIRVGYDWTDIPNPLGSNKPDAARLAVCVEPKCLELPDELPQPVYLVIPRGETVEWTVPDDAMQFRVICLQPSGWSISEMVIVDPEAVQAFQDARRARDEDMRRERMQQRIEDARTAGQR